MTKDLPMQMPARETQLGIAHPLLLVGGALGAGYVAGGGLGTVASRGLLRLTGRLAWRFLILPALKERVVVALSGGRKEEGSWA